MSNSAPGGKPRASVSGGFTSRARSTIKAGDGVRLKLRKFEKSYGGNDYSYIQKCKNANAIPDDVSDNSDATFCYMAYHDGVELKNYDTGFYFYYDIEVPTSGGAWEPSGFYVDATAKVPMLGDDQIDCTIKKSGTTTPAQGAPFHCDKGFDGSGNDARPHWSVTANPVKVIDAADSKFVQQAADLIGANCQSYDTPSCNWTRTQKSSAFEPDQKDWTSITDWADSCPPVEKEHPTVLTFDRSVKIGWEDKVGGKISTKVKADLFIGHVEGELEADYEHSITQEDEWKTGYQYTIPYGYRSALYLQHGKLTVTGDFSILTGKGDRYLIKNGVFTFPLERDVQVEGRGQPIRRGYVQHVDVPCSEKPPDKGAPPPANAKVGRATPAQ